MGNLMLSLKVAFISAAVVSAAVIFKLFVSLLSDFYTVILSYLRPPYLYLLINGIIIYIVASSKFQPKSATNIPAPLPVPADRMSANAYNVVTFSDLCSNDVGNGYGYGGATVVEDRTVETESVVMDGGDNTVKALERTDTAELLSLLSEVEKPLVSRRFAQRKTVKAPHHLPEGKTLGVTKRKRHDTLEGTWKMITESRHRPLTRHPKKSDTCEHVQKEQQHASGSTLPLLPNKMKKSETYSDGEATTSGTTKNQSPVSRYSESGKLREEPWLSLDELNRRADALIKNFYQPMR